MPEGEITSFSVLAQGRKTSCQSQNISMCSGINGTRLFQMLTISFNSRKRKRKRRGRKKRRRRRTRKRVGRREKLKLA